MASLLAAIQSADPLEVVRAAVSACAQESPNTARPVASQRITAFCAPYQIESDVVLANLEGLLATKELERLQGGFWFPGPVRVLRIGDIATILSVQPTEYLQRCIRGVRQTLGVLRELSEIPPELRTESFSSWLGAPESTELWTRSYLEHARARKEHLVGESDAEVFAVSGWDGTKTPVSGLWQRIAIPSAIKDDAWHLIRRGQRPRHYSLVIQQDGAFWEHPCSNAEAHRLGYGLGLLAGTRWSASYNKASNILRVHGPRIPHPELRLLIAVGKPIPDTWQRFQIEDRLVPPVSQVLEKTLGIRTTTK